MPEEIFHNKKQCSSLETVFHFIHSIENCDKIAKVPRFLVINAQKIKQIQPMISFIFHMKKIRYL